MARYKTLQGVAHNIGHLFISLMNYAGNDYVMGHILRFARATGHRTLTIDFVQRKAAPPELFQVPISQVPARYIEHFWRMVKSHGSDPSLVKSATLTLEYDIMSRRPNATFPDSIESPFICDVCITDIRGKDYTAHFDGWWFPESLPEIKPELKTDSRPWWKFWLRRSPVNLKLR